ncbi:MAG: hypothetical protein KatS3mg029_0489 [Saprospiraceae bacterium]|nr:MAG: hypothetical protein KatS3mg029_0489 [Saprospiraceae bacterium]
MNTRHLYTLLAAMLLCFALHAQEVKPVLLKSGPQFWEENISKYMKEEQLPLDARIGKIGYALLQFSNLPSDADLQAIDRNGIRLLEYIPHHTYLAAIPVNLSAQKLAELGVRAIRQIPLELKMTQALYERSIPAHALDGNEVHCILKFHRNIPLDHILSWCRSEGITIERYNRYNNFLRVHFPLDRTEAIASLPWVAYLDLVPPPSIPDDIGGRSLHRSNAIDNDYAGGRHYNGEGVNVLVRDDGFVGPHIDFQGRIDNSYVEPQQGNHGDGVAGVMAGAGNIDPSMKGMAAGAFVYVINYEADFLDETMDLFYDHDVIVTNSSYSNGCNDGYTAITQTVDQQLYNNPTLMHVFSAGNSNGNDCDYGAGSQWGNITGGHKMAKNCITTANVYADATLVESSSRGPAHDGRLKPDIAAHGQGQWSTDEKNQYMEFGGTSAAAPCIAGVMAQLHQAYRELNGGQTAEAALLKAILLNTAEDKGNKGPDFKFGWGLVNAYRAVRTLEDKTYLKASVAPGASKTHTLSIPSGVAQANIMVYWMDPEASQMTSRALINDIDIKIIGPDGTEYLPWKLDPTPDPVILDTPAGKGIDSLNNMEQVVIENPQPGDYTLVVHGKELPFGTHPYYFTWDFRKPQIDLTFPAGGESFEPGQSIRIHWDASGTSGFFVIWLSTDDGNTFTPINSVEGTERLVEWTIPDTLITSKAKLRIVRSASSGQNQVAFQVVPRPKNLRVTKACPDVIHYEWDPVDFGTASASVAYEILTLGDRYMVPIDTVTDTFYDMPTIDQNPLKDHWLAVRALGDNGLRSERTVAVLHNTGLLDCPQQIDLALKDVESPTGEIIFGCGSAQTSVTIEVSNDGLEPQSGLSVAYQLDDLPAVVEPLPGTLAPGESITYTFNQPLVIDDDGTHKLQLAVVAPNDQATFNNLAEMELITIIYEGPGEPVEYQQGFGGDFPPPYYLFSNPDGSIGWERNIITGPTGDTSYVLMVNNRFYSSTGQKDYFQVVPIDLLTGTKPQLSFDLAYTYRSSFFDQLIVEVSTDCGETFEVIYDKKGQDLATVPPQNGYFTPAKADDWRKEKIDLTPYIGNTLLFRFTNVNGRGNVLYLDNINVKEITPPTAAFSTSTDTICQGESITFYNLSTGPDYDVIWDFGPGADPGTSTRRDSVTVTFNELGSFQVTLTVTNIAGTSTAEKTIVVQPLPIPDFEFTNLDETVTFENTTQFGDTYFWNFGDGVFSLAANPTHTYPDFGTYTVILTVTNDCGATSLTKDITIMPTATLEHERKWSALVSPNPSSGTFQVILQGELTSPLSATLYDPLGTIIDVKRVDLASSNSTLRYDTSLPAGIYLLKLESEHQIAVLRIAVH